MKIECTITYVETQWQLKSNLFRLSAPTLDALDDLVRQNLRRRGMPGRGERVEVYMAFDNSTIPQWIRQYAQHYFNRILVITGES